MNRHQRRLAKKQERTPQQPDTMAMILALSDKAVQALNTGRAAEAEQLYRKILDMDPTLCAAYNNLGNALKNQGKLNEAIACYTRACALKPDYTDFHCNLGLAQIEAGNPGAAFTAFRTVIKRNPRDQRGWSFLSSSLQTLSFTAADNELYEDLLHMLQQTSVRPNAVSRPILSALRCHAGFMDVLLKAHEANAEKTLNYREAANLLSAIPLFLKLMELTGIADIEVEKTLTLLRRCLIKDVAAGSASTEGLPFFATLAVQCFYNDYLFYQDDDEERAVDRVQENLENLVKKNQPIPPVWLAALACYRPLHRTPWASGLTGIAWPNEMKKLIQQQVVEPLEEKALQASIPSLTATKDATSQAVRDQYEENPYPRWTRVELFPQQRSLTTVIKDLFPHYDLDSYTSPDPTEILVAGCGTGRHPLFVASRFSNARILAIDLSTASLAYALRKTRELGITNIDYAQADILELASLNKQFDIVESLGVLHHLEDPMAGWRSLLNLLKPGGFMNIALYSETARQGIVKARGLIKEKGYTPSPNDIRRCRQDIISRMDEPDLALVPAFMDFYSLSACRDLIFHVKEHRFTLPQIEAVLRELGLHFIGFEIANIDTLGRFRMANQGPRDEASLDLWHQFEQQNPHTFSGMYQFWCRKL